MSNSTKDDCAPYATMLSCPHASTPVHLLHPELMYLLVHCIGSDSRLPNFQRWGKVAGAAARSATHSPYRYIQYSAPTANKANRSTSCFCVALAVGG